MSTADFEKLVPQVQRAFAYRDAFEHMGFEPVQIAIAYTMLTEGHPVGVKPPAGSASIAVTLAHGVAGAEDLTVIAGFVPGVVAETWVDATLRMARAVWGRLALHERAKMRGRHVPADELARLVGELLHRGVVPPRLDGRRTDRMAALAPRRP
jgi:hypothetical protein